MKTQNQLQHSGRSCCTPMRANNTQGSKAFRTWPAGAVAIGAAILASACCWLPLTLLALGLSRAGLARFVVGARWIFIAFGTIALGIGFYLVYRRKITCSPDTTCTPDGWTKFNRKTMWVCAVLVLVIATFSYYSGPLLQAWSDIPKNVSPRYIARSAKPPVQPNITTNPTSSVASGAAMTHFYFYRMKGIDCRLCADGLQAAIAKVPGVIKATVSYRHGTAHVQAAVGFDPQNIAKRVSGIGYKTRLAKPESTTKPCCQLR